VEKTDSQTDASGQSNYLMAPTQVADALLTDLLIIILVTSKQNGSVKSFDDKKHIE